MNKLFKGVLNFRHEDYEKNRDIFEKLSNSQSPHTFFIGCSDSRVVPNLITKTFPGELFVVRNIANIIPPSNINDGVYKCTASALEYAVKILKVKNIVVCGHSNCGGLKALYYPEDKLKEVPLVKKWLEIVEPLKEKVAHIKDENKRAWKIEQLNILSQIKNLFTYDFVKKSVEDEELKIYGWYYVIPKGEVYNYNFYTGEFELIK